MADNEGDIVMETFVRPTSQARTTANRGLSGHRGALETMIPEVYIRRYPPAENSTAKTGEAEQKPRNERPKKLRAASRRK